MKLNAAVNEVILSNVGTTGEFKIRNSAKAFKILSDGLYSNKIRAIIREISCNAVDSHIAAGKADLPFEVHLPTMYEPWFSVRDFGVGLDANQVINIYTTYFESTKTDSNDFIGALGLGSKSPFSYTENFTVTAIKDGIKRIYSAFINDVGVPSIAEMNEEPTSEGNGVEVKFSVPNRYDFNTFRNEAQYVFSWFEHKPTITGIDNFQHHIITYKEKNIIPGVHVLVDGGDACTATMGNIPYPLNNVAEADKHFGSLASLLKCNLILEFEIGELDFAASREQLSFVPFTIDNICKKLEELNTNLVGHLAAKANAITNEWERAFYLCEQSQTRLYNAAVTEYVANTKFCLFDAKGYYGRKEFDFPVADLTDRGLTIQGLSIRSYKSQKLNEKSIYVQGSYIKSIPILVSKEAVFVLNDLKTGCLSRARYHFTNHNGGKYATVYCISHNAESVAERQVEYDKFISELHNPPIVIKASALQKQVKEKPLSTQGIMQMVKKSEWRRGFSREYAWASYGAEIDENETYYYVCLSNYEVINEDGTLYLHSINTIRDLMDKCGIPAIANINIFGVRKNRIKELKELDNWVKLEEKLKIETAKITDEHIAALVVAELLDLYNNRVYTNAKVAELVGPDSDYAKYVSLYGNVKRSDGNVAQLSDLCAKYGKAVQVEKIKKSIEKIKTALHAKYPLLKFMDSRVSNDDLVHYIKLVDNTGETK